MRRALTIAAGLTAMLVGLAGPAAAETQTVTGTGDVKKLYVSNGQNTLVAKVWGIGKPCDAAHYLWVTISSRQTGRYRAEAGCYSGGSWLTGLYWSAKGDFTDAKKIACADFVFGWNATTKAYRVAAPRTCLSHAPNMVRVTAEGSNYASANPGAPLRTRLLTRG